MNRLLEFWMGHSGRLSSTRLLATYTTVVVMAVWAVISVRQNVLNPLPESLVVLVLGATGMVQAPKFMPKREPTEGVSTP